MAEDQVYLRPNIVVEPLVDSWYAWAHLIPPATAAMNIANRHLRIMESYVNAPNVHRAAAKNPAMAGGPFVDYEDQRATEVSALIEKTRSTRRDLLELAAAIKQLNEILLSEAGAALRPRARAAEGLCRTGLRSEQPALVSHYRGAALSQPLLRCFDAKHCDVDHQPG
jgi:hypothetical protein